MATRHGFTGKKPALLAALIVLLVALFGAGCKGFFTDNTLSSISIQPPSPQIEVGTTTAQTLQAWGTYSDNSRAQITSGVAWTSSDPNVISIDPNTGLATGLGSGGTATITAAAEGLSATATATAYLGNVTALTVCTGTYDTGTCPAATWTISGTKGGTQNYYAKATSNGSPVDVTTVATWVVTPTATAGSVSCDATATPAVCTVEAGTTPTGPYVITITYPNIPAITANITVD